MNNLALLSLYWVTSAAGGTPRVEFQREVVGYVGQNVTLRCSLVDGGQNTRVVQVSWVRSPEQKLVVFNPSFGTSYPSGDWAGRLSVSNDSARLKETSLTVTACLSQDQGQYSCDFTIFPSGIHRGQITLTIAELVEIPVLEPVLLSCLQSPWNPSPNSSGTVQWFHWSQAGGDWSLVLTVQLEGRAARCSGELSACSTDLYWTPSLSQAGWYRCHWTNGTGHFNRTLLLRASSTGPLLSGLRSHTITALVLTGLGVSVTLLILVLLYWRMALRKGPLLSGLRSHTITALVLTGLGVSVTLLILVLLYWRITLRKGPLLSGLRSHTITALVLTGLGVSVTLLILVLLYWRMTLRKGKLSGAVELTQPLTVVCTAGPSPLSPVGNHEITYTSVRTAGSPPSGGTENDRRESSLYANIVRRSMEQSVYSTVRVREEAKSIQIPPEPHPTDS
ncbi:UNVERIFIED_CONTAM: hypothetical protein FKN15_070076 [Acipenser sinensis]